MKFAYQPVTSAELRTVVGPRPGARAVSDVIVWHMYAKGARPGGIYNRRPVRGKSILAPSSASLHAAGRAVDIMVPNLNVGDEILLRLLKAADAIGVCEIIWNRKRYTAKGTFPYKGKSPHTDHLHIGLTAEMADNRDPQLKQWVTHFMFG